MLLFPAVFVYEMTISTLQGEDMLQFVDLMYQRPERRINRTSVDQFQSRLPFDTEVRVIGKGFERGKGLHLMIVLRSTL